MASKVKTGEALVKELARKEPNKKCFDCNRGVRHTHTHTQTHTVHTHTQQQQWSNDTHHPVDSLPSHLSAVVCPLLWVWLCVAVCGCVCCVCVGVCGCGAVRCQGPQQNVNLTLHTFVCTSCSGLLSATKATPNCTPPTAVHGEVLTPGGAGVAVLCCVGVCCASVVTSIIR